MNIKDCSRPLLFNQKIAELVRKALINHRNHLGAQLCWEASISDPQEFISVLANQIVKECQTLGCFRFVGSHWRLTGIGRELIVSNLSRALDSEEVLTFFDFKLSGGCGIDFTPETSGKYEVLFTSWGDGEKAIKELNKIYPDGVIFRGN